MVRSRWRIKRIMVVPAQWQGSVQHFYHFFFGYFMPLVLWQERTGAMEFTVRDCGPMNPWFSLLKPGTDVAFIPPGVMLQRVLTHRQEMQVLHGWDDPTRFHRTSLDTFSRVILERLDVSAEVDSMAPRITVLHRAPSPEFFHSDDSEVFSSGAAFRSLPNAEAIAEGLSGLGNVSFVDTAAQPPEDQVRILSNTDLLVAQHGAGLSNMVWMPRGGAVLEIKPPLPPTINEIFANLAAARNLGHLTVDQSDEHASVDPREVRTNADRLLGSPGAYVPGMPGRLPMRILRALPRRL